MNTPLPTVARSNSLRRTTANVVPPQYNTMNNRHGYDFIPTFSVFIFRNHLPPRGPPQPFFDMNNGKRTPQYQTLNSSHNPGHANSNGNVTYETTDGIRRRASMDQLRNNGFSSGRIEV